MMGEIYAKARWVNTFLGTDCPSPLHPAQVNDSQLRAHVWSHVYWSRSWIIHEVVNARNYCLLVGKDREVSQNDFLMWAFDGRRREEPMAAYISDLHSFFLNRRLLMKAPSILQVLSMTRASTATDLRDSIYAKLGISRDGSAIVPSPSYALTVADLYRDLVKAHFLRTLSLYIICFAGPTTMRLPSWVPDWSSSPGTRPLLGASLERYEAQVCNATPGEKEGACPTGVLFSEDGSSLFVDGWMVDTIGVFDVNNPMCTTEGHLLEVLLRTLTTQQIFVPDMKELSFSKSYYLEFARSLTEGEAFLPTTHSSATGHITEAAFRDFITQYRQTYIAGKTLQTRALDYLTVNQLESTSLPRSGPPFRASYRHAITQMLIGRTLLETVHGRPALVPASTAGGDLVYILGYCPVHVVLRQVDSAYVLIGECYVDGFMDFDMWKELSLEGRPETLFEIR